MKTLFTLVLITLSVTSFSQIIDEKYIVDAEFQGNEFFNTECQTDSIDQICSNATFTVVSIDDAADIVKIKIDEGRICNDYARNGKIYCVKKAVFTSGSVHLIKKDKKWNADLGGGVLTIPFKFDTESFKVFPSGEIGGVGGLRLNHIKSNATIILGGILGLSTIPLNDLNSNNTNEIKTVSGVTVGGGISINVAMGFQFGIYYGNDFYNTDNTKYSKDWISFGLGYDFFNFAKEKKNERKAMISAPL